MGKVMVGASAVVKIDGQVVGLYDSISYGNVLGTEGIFILGRLSASEISLTSSEVVQVSCSGFRIVGEGVKILPKVPKLQDLLNFVNVQIEVKDRKTGENIAVIKDCVPSSWSETQQAKGTTRLNVTYQGLLIFTEDGDETEASDSTDLPG